MFCSSNADLTILSLCGLPKCARLSVQTKSLLDEKSQTLDNLQKNLGESRSESQLQLQQKEQQLTQLKLDLDKVSVLDSLHVFSADI